MAEQNNTLKQQRFENTFFQLLTLFNSIVNSLDLRKSSAKTDVISTGRDCFEIFYKRLVGFLKNSKQHIPNYNIIDAPIEEVLKAFDEFYRQNRSDMSHYFRTIYHIIKFVDRSEVANKRQYIAIVRAQLSSYEQILLFYNCLHENGKQKFKPMIESYALFKNIDDSLLINEDHMSEYKQSAYG
jgi:hypothetical protein